MKNNEIPLLKDDDTKPASYVETIGDFCTYGDCSFIVFFIIILITLLYSSSQI